jgi:hypothetical protein
MELQMGDRGNGTAARRAEYREDEKDMQDMRRPVSFIIIALLCYY